MNEEMYMRLALDIAQRELEAREFPVGCVIVRDDIVISDSSISPFPVKCRINLFHAEICALYNLCQTYSHNDLNTATLYCTLEPCMMCFSTILNAGISRVVYSYEDVFGGGSGILSGRLSPYCAQKRVEVTGGVLRKESQNLFKQFYYDYGLEYLKETLFYEHVMSNG